MRVRSLGWEGLEEKMATHSDILAWKISQRSLVGNSLKSGQESDMTERLSMAHITVIKVNIVAFTLCTGHFSQGES